MGTTSGEEVGLRWESQLLHVSRSFGSPPRRGSRLSGGTFCLWKLFMLVVFTPNGNMLIVLLSFFFQLHCFSQCCSKHDLTKDVREINDLSSVPELQKN